MNAVKTAHLVRLIFVSALAAGPLCAACHHDSREARRVVVAAKDIPAGIELDDSISLLLTPDEAQLVALTSQTDATLVSLHGSSDPRSVPLEPVRRPRPRPTMRPRISVYRNIGD